MDFVRSSLNNLNNKLDAFVEKQEKLELCLTAVKEHIASQEKTVEGIIESVDFTAKKVKNAKHSLHYTCRHVAPHSNLFRICGTKCTACFFLNL